MTTIYRWTKCFFGILFEQWTFFFWAVWSLLSKIILPRTWFKSPLHYHTNPHVQRHFTLLQNVKKLHCLFQASKFYSFGSYMPTLNLVIDSFRRYLYNNKITSLPANVFSSLGLCTWLFVCLKSVMVIQKSHLMISRLFNCSPYLLD